MSIQVKIKEPPYKLQRYEDIDYGSAFKHNGVFYIKCRPFGSMNHAISLPHFAPAKPFSGFTEVTPVKSAVFTIEE